MSMCAMCCFLRLLFFLPFYNSFVLLLLFFLLFLNVFFITNISKAGRVSSTPLCCLCFNCVLFIFLECFLGGGESLFSYCVLFVLFSCPFLFMVCLQLALCASCCFLCGLCVWLCVLCWACLFIVYALYICATFWGSAILCCLVCYC